MQPSSQRANPSSSLPLSRKEKAAIAVALSWAAGLTDVLGYLTLYHSFVAHMTGNTVSAVLHWMERNWGELLHRGLPIPLFFVGLLVGEIVLIVIVVDLIRPIAPMP